MWWFIQELNNCIIGWSEMTNIIIGGDWNCTLTKTDKKSGAFWKPTPFRNLLLTTMETFDLIDIYRARHPNLQLFLYESKSLQVKSRIDFFLVAKSLVKYVRKVGITVSIALDHFKWIRSFKNRTSINTDMIKKERLLCFDQNVGGQKKGKTR